MLQEDIDLLVRYMLSKELDATRANDTSLALHDYTTAIEGAVPEMSTKALIRCSDEICAARIATEITGRPSRRFPLEWVDLLADIYKEMKKRNASDAQESSSGFAASEPVA